MHPITERLVVVPESSLKRGANYRRFFVFGWALGLTGIGFGIGVIITHRHHTRTLMEATNRVAEITALQNKETATFVQAWEDQQRARAVIMEFADLIRKRDEIVKYNEENGPVPRPKKRKSK